MKKLKKLFDSDNNCICINTKNFITAYKEIVSSEISDMVISISILKQEIFVLSNNTQNNNTYVNIETYIRNILNNKDGIDDINVYNTFVSIIEYFIKEYPNVLLILTDIHYYLKQPVFAEKFSYYIKSIKVILLQKYFEIPSNISDEILLYNIDNYSIKDIKEICDMVDNTEYTESFYKAFYGLTFNEILSTCKEIMIEQNNINNIKYVLRKKEEIIKKSGHLEYIHTENINTNVYGLNNFKQWINRRKLGFSSEAKKYNISTPKGVLMLGIPGTGKSLSVKYVSKKWEMPILKLDMGKIFNKYVGESERQLRDAISLAEQMSPCILWIDEIEKSINTGNEGVSSNILGYMLNWMQENTSEVFIIATANSIAKLPPELLRKGRFDEIFYVDLPGKDIINDYINDSFDNYGIENHDKEYIIEYDKYTLSEIKDIINEYMYYVMESNNTKYNREIFYNIVDTTIPIVELMADKINVLKEFIREKNIKKA